MSKRIIVLSGFAGSGKDTVADMIMSGSDLTTARYAFADPIRDAVSVAFGIEKKYLTESRYKNVPNRRWSKRLGKKVSNREIINKFGQEMKSIFCENIWIHAVMDKITDHFDYNQSGVFIITDLRFKKELGFLDTLREKGYVVDHYMVWRDESLPAWLKQGLSPCKPWELEIIKKDFHAPATELEWCEANPEFRNVIYNNGSLQELVEEIKRKVGVNADIEALLLL